MHTQTASRMSELDFRMQQHLAHEIYRHQQMLQRLPDPYPAMLPVPPPTRATNLPLSSHRHTLPGNVETQLQNADLWNEFHQIGTEMIITKTGRRMFPSLRLTIGGLEEDDSYCVLLEMVPIGDCRYKFSGSQWIPAGGAEPQSPQRMYMHPDSPATGGHWTSQPVLFNKVKLTNNTLDSSGHIVLTSMHKYQPRIHIIRTPDPSQIPWAPQQAFTFEETEFVAVTAYQNDRITKLKIDNNPFAKGFRATGQSRCKRKATGVESAETHSLTGSSGASSGGSSSSNGGGGPYNGKADTKNDHHNEIRQHGTKRMRSDSSACSVSSLDDSGLSVSGCSSGTSSPDATAPVTEEVLHTSSPAHQPPYHEYPMAAPSHVGPDFGLLSTHYQQMVTTPAWLDLAFNYFRSMQGGMCPPFPPPRAVSNSCGYTEQHQQQHQQQQQQLQNQQQHQQLQNQQQQHQQMFLQHPHLVKMSTQAHNYLPTMILDGDSTQRGQVLATMTPALHTLAPLSGAASLPPNGHHRPQKKCSFSISSILGCDS